MASRGSPHILIIEARFYEELADALGQGATSVLDAAGATYDRIAVPGALEIPVALAMALEAGLFEDEDDDDETHRYDGCVVLGCVIRGETYHFEIVSNETSRGLMQLATEETVALGNGVLTVENEEQASARAKGGEQSKGGDAARACLRLIDIRETFDTMPSDDASGDGAAAS